MRLKLMSLSSGDIPQSSERWLSLESGCRGDQERDNWIRPARLFPVHLYLKVLWEWLALPRLEGKEGPRNQIFNKNTIFLFPMVPGTVLSSFSTAGRKRKRSSYDIPPTQRHFLAF